MEVSGMPEALMAMRNPMNSWNKADSKMLYEDEERIGFLVGKNDKNLSQRLQQAGPEHCKHLRMIQVWAEIEAPRFWEIELDTYRVGVEKVSCSTMHKITSKEFAKEDFCIASDEWSDMIVSFMNDRLDQWKEATDEEEKKMRWRDINECLPKSYIQKRTYMFSYAALRNIVKQRAGHKLYEWKQFIEWCNTLPESWMIFQ